MMKYSLSIPLAIATLFLSACQIFQTIETPQPSTAPSAQEVLTQALGNFYDLQSGTFIQNYVLTLYKGSTANDRWTVNLRDNWQTQTSQSLADVHVAFTLPAPSSAGEIAQGLINFKTARDNTERFIQLNSANFSGKDGHVLDDVLAPWTNQWFSLPQETLASTGFAWIFNLPNLLQSLPREAVVTTNYFSISEAKSVQTDEEQATLFTVSLNVAAINQLLTLASQTTSIPASEIDTMTKFLAASEFNGSLLVGNASQQLKKLDGTLVIQSANDTSQKLNLVMNVEIANADQNPPVAIPTQALPFPTELANPNNVLQ